MLYTMDDKTTAGEVVVVIRPNQGPAKVFSYVNIEDAFSSWRDSVIYCEYKSFDDFKDTFQGDDAFIQEAKENLDAAGIDPSSPFVEWSPCDSWETEFLPMPVNKMDLLYDVIRYDAYQAQIFLAEGQSYRDYISEIYDSTRGHAQPSSGQIRKALFVAEESEEAANE